MDKRLIVELIPGPAFLAGNAVGGIFAGALVAAAATGLAIVLRWRWDQTLPLFAISIFGLTILLLTIGLILDDTGYIKISNTIGSVAFAAIIGFGMLLKPSLLQRTLGFSIQISSRGWISLSVAWIVLSLIRAGANEVVWRNFSDHTWALYNGISDVAWIIIFVMTTTLFAHLFWQEKR